MWRGVCGALVLAMAFTAGPAGAQAAPSTPSGFYLGAPDTAATPFGWSAMGTRGSRFDWAVSPSSDTGNLQFGYNRQLGAWSFGIDGGWSWGHAEGCARLEQLNVTTGCPSANWYGTAAGRIGYAWDRLNAYTVGGAAFSHWDSVGLFNGPGSGGDPDRTNRVALGWVLGGGLEYAVGGAWSLRAEYTYLDFGRDGAASSSGSYAPGMVEQWDHERSHMLMFGLRRRM